MLVGVGLASSMLFVKTALAEANADLTALATGTVGLLTDNQGTIMTYILGIAGVVIFIGIGFALINRARRNVVGAVSGGRRRR